jgi:hypothetical protein
MDDRHELLYIGGGWRKTVTGRRVLRDEYAAAFAPNEQEISR